MKKFLLVGLALLSTNCLASFEESKLARAQSPVVDVKAAPVPSDYCRSLDSEQMWATGAGIGLGASGLGGALGSLALDEENKDWRRGLQIGSAVAVAGGITLVLVGNAKQARWVEVCSQ